MISPLPLPAIQFGIGANLNAGVVLKLMPFSVLQNVFLRLVWNLFLDFVKSRGSSIVQGKKMNALKSKLEDLKIDFFCKTLFRVGKIKLIF